MGKSCTMNSKTARLFIKSKEPIRVQHGLSPSSNLINKHKIGKIASVASYWQMLEGIGKLNTRNGKFN